MKKLVTFFVAIVYLGISSGMAFQVHYCMDKVAGLSVVSSMSDKCGKCGMSGNACCRDEVKFLKLQDVHKQAVSLSTLTQPVVAISRELPQYLFPGYDTYLTIHSRANAPPPLLLHRRNIIFCRFNI